MQRKYLPLIVVILFCIIVFSITFYNFITQSENVPANNSNTTINNNNNTNSNIQEEDDDTLDLPTTGNDTVFTTNSDTTLRVINEYDQSVLSADKNLLIMFASWCPNCQAEISEIQKILAYYKNNKNVNVVLIAHEYDTTVKDLIRLVENDVDFGKVEIKLDLGRVIRKTIDPAASTIPISYVVNKNGNVLEIHNESLTLEKAIEMVGK